MYVPVYTCTYVSQIAFVVVLQGKRSKIDIWNLLEMPFSSYIPKRIDRYVQQTRLLFQEKHRSVVCILLSTVSKTKVWHSDQILIFIVLFRVSDFPVRSECAQYPYSHADATERNAKKTSLMPSSVNPNSLAPAQSSYPDTAAPSCCDRPWLLRMISHPCILGWILSFRAHKYQAQCWTVLSPCTVSGTIPVQK